MTNVDLDQCQSSIYYQDASGTIDGCSITNPSGDGLIAYSYAAKAGQPRVTASPMDADLAVPGEKVAMTVTVSNTEILGTGAADSWATYAYASNGAITYTVTGCTVSDWTYGVVPYDDGPGVAADINNNAIVNCDYALGSSASDPAVHDAESNWYGVTAAADVAAMVDGAFDYSPWYGANYVNDPHSTPWVWHVDDVENSTIQEAIDGATAGDTVYVNPGVYAENLSIDIPLALIGIDDGSKAKPEINPGSGVGVVLSNDDITVQGFAIHGVTQGILGWLDDVHYNANFGYGNLHLLDNDIYDVNNSAHGFGIYLGTETERYNPDDPLGIYDPSLTDLLDFTGLVISGNEIWGCSGAAITLQSMRTYGADPLEVSDNNVHDNSMSALWIDGCWDLLVTGNSFTGNNHGIFVSNYGDGYYEGTPDAAFDPKNIDITLNYIENQTDKGIALYDGYTGDITVAENSISGNGTGFYNFVGGVVIAEYNYWGSFDGPSDPTGTDEAEPGVCYDPSTMVNAVPAGSLGDPVTDGTVDYCPWLASGVMLSPADILYHCSGSFTFDVGITVTTEDLEAGSYVFTYPAELTFEDLTVSDPNITAYTLLDDQATGYDELTVDFLVAAGSLDGPADLFTIELSGSTSYCSGEDISLTSIEMYDTNNDLIDSPLPGAITLVADCEDPIFTVNGPADGGFYNTAPVLDIGATDNCDIDAVYYQIDGCDDASWTAIAGPGYTGGSFADAAWTVPGFAGLSEANHCVRFKVIDDNERGNADSCSYTWCFTKDVSAPASPTDLAAEPGHNKVKLSWNSSSSGDVVGYRIQRVAWGDYPWYLNGSEPAYPADESSGTNVFDGTGNDHTDTHLLDNTTRDVYY
ncbi:hypothetical protein GF377_07235, partial [candidate division GN15 bacterium]|nr:hypothetical protein [candidate division GN15 bacterium]